MSDIPKDPPSGGEELDLGEIEDGEDLGQDGLDQEPGEDGEGAGGEAGEEEGADGEVEPPNRPRRKTEAQRWRERAERAEREAAEARGFQRAADQFRVPQGPNLQQQEAERVAKWEAENLPMMSAQEVSAYYYQKGQREISQALMAQQLQTRDELDRRDFERTVGKNARYRDEVEREYNSQRQRGNLLASRQEILERLVGRDAIARANADAPRQRRAAAQRVAGQQTRPTNGRGDGAAGRQRGTWGDPEFDKEMARRALREGGF